MRYRLDFEQITEGLAKRLKRDLIDYEPNLPGFVRGTMDDQLDLYLVVSPDDYEQLAHEILFHVVNRGRAAVFVTPRGYVKNILSTQALFSSGNLLYAVPIHQLAEGRPSVLQGIENMTAVRGMEAEILQEQVDNDQHHIIDRVNSNPRYILTELNHMKLLRENKEIPRNEGTRLEKISESALSHLFPTYAGRGGEDDLFEELPDNLFWIHSLAQDPDIDEYETVLGVVDTKSGESANFASEDSDKHLEYMKRGRDAGVDPDKIAHIFVVLGITGDNEIDFFDRMKENYRDDEYMVVLTAEGFMTLMAAYLSCTVSRSVKLKTNTFQKAIYPLFNDDHFNDNDLDQYIRPLSQTVDKEEYQMKYQKRNKLLVISREVVIKHLKDVAEGDSGIEFKMERYFNQE